MKKLGSKSVFIINYWAAHYSVLLCDSATNKQTGACLANECPEHAHFIGISFHTVINESIWQQRLKIDLRTPS